VSGEGRHTIVYHAVDAAGNASDDVTRTIWIQAGASREPARGGFWSTSANPVATFTAAKRFGAPCPAAVTLTADRDAYVDAAAPDATFGSAATGWIGGGRRVVIGFPLPPAPDCTVASAELRLTTVGGAGPRRVDAYRAGASWNEASVAWATQPGYLGAPASSTTGVWEVTAQV
ncbi:MAG: large repetitive protein, partial [Thermoleophilaceae bacterium]|nr:large repetitive protein [Thermoleophilaceae bacterium]